MRYAGRCAGGRLHALIAIAFPESAQIFSVTPLKIPCSIAQGIPPQTIELMQHLTAEIAALGQK
jgi:hypothetical protein